MGLENKRLSSIVSLAAFQDNIEISSLANKLSLDRFAVKF